MKIKFAGADIHVRNVFSDTSKPLLEIRRAVKNDPAPRLPPPLLAMGPQMELQEGEASAQSAVANKAALQQNDKLNFKASQLLDMTVHVRNADLLTHSFAKAISSYDLGFIDLDTLVSEFQAEKDSKHGPANMRNRLTEEMRTELLEKLEAAQD